MMLRRLVLAGGVCVLAARALVALDAPADRRAQAPSDQPRFVNARVETRQAAGSLARVFPDLVAHATPAWIGYAVPAMPGGHQRCEPDRPARAYLEGRPARADRTEPDHPAAGGRENIAVLFRAEGGKVQKVRLFSMDCDLDAGGLPVTWLTGVGGAESVALLRGMLHDRPTTGSEVRENSLVMAIALHEDPAAQRALEALVAAGQPMAVRKRAAFWLGSARGDEGFDTLRRMLASQDDPAFRRELVFPVSLSRRQESVDVLIRLAREDASADVRKQAMFWLGQKAGSRSASTLAEAAVNDPDTEVKKRAVFGLSRMPNGEGVPRLIEVARTNRNPAVRRQAMFWLGQSNDPRALAFLVEVLK